VGLGAVAGSRLAGAERIIAVDLSEERLEHARAQGATETLLGGPDTVEEILERAVAGRGATACPSSSTSTSAVSSTWSRS
jgi:threonine dehydrogenase-like Zn-dependent dehydrogenase